MQNKAVVLAGDSKYVQFIETTIKSMALYHENIDFYVLNQDIPQEWFFNLRDYISQTQNTLTDIKLFNEYLSNQWDSTRLPHINYMTYARYFIPNFIPNDTVLYLDSDLVVTDNLDELFSLDLTNYYVAAVRMAFGVGIGFNAGMMVINNKRWKEEGIVEKLMNLTIQEFDNLLEGDQTVLNIMFKDQWLRLEDQYNFQVGYDMGAVIDGHEFIFDIPLEPLPKIIHYISGVKPWLLLSNMRLREIWWFYHNLSWETILASKRSSLPKYLKIRDNNYKLNAFILTDTDQIEYIEELIVNAPNCLFHIAAYTKVSNRIMKLLVQHNVRVYHVVLPTTIDSLINKADVYLDIHHGEKNYEIFEKLVSRQVPFISFESVKSNDIESKVFPDDQWQGIVDYFNELMKQN